VQNATWRIYSSIYITINDKFTHSPTCFCLMHKLPSHYETHPKIFLFTTTAQKENKNTWMPRWPRTFIKPHQQFTVLFISLGTHLTDTGEWVSSCLNLSSHSPHYFVLLLFCLAQWQEWTSRLWLHFKMWDRLKPLTNCHNKWWVIPIPFQITLTRFQYLSNKRIRKIYFMYSWAFFLAQ
jgi:hypothetical protein